MRPTATGDKASANKERFGLSKVPGATSKLIILVVTLVSMLCAGRQNFLWCWRHPGGRKGTVSKSNITTGRMRRPHNRSTTTGVGGKKTTPVPQARRGPVAEPPRELREKPATAVAQAEGGRTRQRRLKREEWDLLTICRRASAVSRGRATQATVPP